MEAQSGLGQGNGTGGSVLPGTTPAVAVGGDGDWKAQRRVGGSDWDSVVVCTTPAVAGTAAAEAESSRKRRRLR